MPKSPGVQYVNGSIQQAESATGSVIVPMPFGGVTQVNDILLTMLVHNAASALTAPAGWTLALSATNGNSVWAEVYWRRADGTEPANYTFTGVGTICRGNMRNWRGCKRTGSPIGATAYKANASGAATAIIDGITTTALNSALISIIGALGNNASFVRPVQPSMSFGTSFNWSSLPIDPAVTRFQDTPGLTFGGGALSFVFSMSMKPEIGTTGAFNAFSGSISGLNVVTMLELLAEADPTYDTPGTRYYSSFEQPVPMPYWPPSGVWDITEAGPRTYDGAALRGLSLSQHTARNGVQRTITLTTNQDTVDALAGKLISPPLAAQTIDGTFDLCNFLYIDRNDSAVGNPIPDGYFKAHVWVAIGDTGAVRGVLLDNYVDASSFTDNGNNGRAQALTTPQTLTPVAVQAGDRLVIEFGYRAIAQTPYPPPTRVPSMWAACQVRFGTNAGGNFGGTSSTTVPFSDMIGGSGAGPQPPWFEFSATIVELTPSYTPPANTTGATAKPITVVPYDSGTLDTHGLTDPYRRLWWEFTAPATGRYTFYTLGTTQDLSIQFAASYPPSGLSYTTGLESSVNRFAITGICIVVKQCTVGETFFVSTCIKYNNANALPGDGTVRLRVVQETPLANNDVIVSSSGLTARFTEAGQLSVISPDFSGTPISGLAIDYTRRPMADFNSPDWPTPTNTSLRLYTALFGTDIVEILDLATLNIGEAEIDYIDAPLGSGGFPRLQFNMAALALSRAGLLAVGYFGNGFIYVGNQGASYQNAASTLGTSSINSLDATHADSQPDEPFAAAQRDDVGLGGGGTNYIEFGQRDDDADIIYYTSGGWYRPVADSDTIYRFNVVTREQLPPFVTGLPSAGPNPGLKGVFPLPDTPTTPGGGMLVCAGSVVKRLNAAGVVVQTYTPSLPALSMSLSDVELQADGRYFWCWDEASSSLFKFDMQTGDQLLGPDGANTLWTQLSYGSSTSIVIVRLEPYPPANTLPAGCPAALSLSPVTGRPGCADQLPV